MKLEMELTVSYSTQEVCSLEKKMPLAILPAGSLVSEKK